jgi:cell division protein FtsI/penicillin-binding protein 2
LFRNRAVTDLYEPGSVSKTLTMAAAIDMGLVSPGTTYFDSGTVVKGGYTFKNWDFSSNGIQTMVDVLQKSLNTGAIWVSDLLGPTNLYTYLQRFGFGEEAHSGLGGEATGLLRTNKIRLVSVRPGHQQLRSGMAATLSGDYRHIRCDQRRQTDAPICYSRGRRRRWPAGLRACYGQAGDLRGGFRTMVDMLNQVVDGNPVHKAKVKGYHVGGKTGTTLVTIPTGYALDSTSPLSWLRARRRPGLHHAH